MRLYQLEANSRQIAHQHLRAVPAKEMGLEAVIRETRQRCQEYDEEISASVRAWKWGTNLATISDEAQMWRYVRLNTALTWLSLGLGAPGSDRVFGDPSMSEQATVQWFLTHWWQIGGVQMRAMYEMGT
ncbi:hypothetical protein OVA24_16635 [Luteolibacter sp. SL250]|uniref:hypothetical protein n=1 Tax=Luteolibacter sp. SL250 TaxID=2995170 RepID=UPI002270B78C|nr:hypothetical protein [Luteolibacter sp. SL250]WAC18859.1 hypothetical protein OVA24_16635 [Luteolibacter sp. SL250]